jgi:hypothetical protein
MSVYCKACSHKFELGPLNAREIPPAADTPFDMGWLCRCDHCGEEADYRRADFVS